MTPDSNSTTSSSPNNRGKSLPNWTAKLSLKQRLTGWAQYEEKARNLERNFQKFAKGFRFTASCTRRLPDSQLNQSAFLVPENEDSSSAEFLDINRTTIVPTLDQGTSFLKTPYSPAKSASVYVSKFWEELGTFYQRIFGSLRALSITQTQELEVREIERACKASLERIQSRASPSCEESRSVIVRDLRTVHDCFTKIINKIQMIASRSFQNYKLREVQAVFSSLVSAVQRGSMMHILPSLGLAVGKLRDAAVFAKLSRIEERSREFNRRNAVSRLREHAQFRQRKSRELKLRNLFGVCTVLREHGVRLVETKAILRWRLAYRGCEPDFPQFYQKAFDSLNSPQPWGSLHLSVHNAFLRRCGGTGYADFVRCAGGSLVCWIPKDGYLAGKETSSGEDISATKIEFGFASGGIVSSLVQSWTNKTIDYLPTEISNLGEEQRFCRKVDLPFVEDAGSAVGTLYVPIRAAGELIGVVRVYKKADRMKFGENAISFGKTMANCLGTVLPGLSRAIEREADCEAQLRALKAEKEISEARLRLYEETTRNTSRILSSQSIEEVVELGEEIAKKATDADLVYLLGYNAELNSLFQLKNGTEIAESLLGLEALRRGKPVETSRTDALTGQQKQVLYLPVSSGAPVCRGVLLAERIGSTIHKWIDAVSSLDVLDLMLPMCMGRASELAQMAECRAEIMERRTGRLREAGVSGLFNAVETIHARRLRSSWDRISTALVFQFGRTHVLSSVHFNVATMHASSEHCRDDPGQIAQIFRSAAAPEHATRQDARKIGGRTMCDTRTIHRCHAGCMECAAGACLPAAGGGGNGADRETSPCPAGTLPYREEGSIRGKRRCGFCWQNAALQSAQPCTRRGGGGLSILQGRAARRREEGWAARGSGR